jgi:glycosyltransferase involved in cell wall biosynthesis
METSSKKIYILIPAYNEASKIGSVVANLKSAGYHNILVINDGSKDATGKIAAEAGAEVIDQIINRGQGAALRTGIEYLREKQDPDVIITFDADGQHQVTDIPAIIEPILSNKADIVLGTRFSSKKSNVNIIKKIVLKAGVLFTNIISNIKLTDTHNGFRALGKKAINSIEISHRGMEHASDIIDEITKNKLIYVEVPVEIIYSNYSKMKGQRTSGFMKMGLKILIKKLTQ